jgi:hypothetical protein
VERVYAELGEIIQLRRKRREIAREFVDVELVDLRSLPPKIFFHTNY